MPVQKFRSAAEMPRPPRATGPELEARIRALWNRAFLLSPPDYVRGVQRFRSIEEANEEREQRTIARMRARGG